MQALICLVEVCTQTWILGLDLFLDLFDVSALFAFTNVKAKTAEKMGPVGEGRAIEARAVCLLAAL